MASTAASQPWSRCVSLGLPKCDWFPVGLSTRASACTSYRRAHQCFTADQVPFHFRNRIKLRLARSMTTMSRSTKVIEAAHGERDVKGRLALLRLQQFRDIVYLRSDTLSIDTFDHRRDSEHHGAPQISPNTDTRARRVVQLGEPKDAVCLGSV